MEIITKQDVLDFINYLLITYKLKDVEYFSGIRFQNIIETPDQNNTKIDRLIQHINKLEYLSDYTISNLKSIEEDCKTSDWNGR